ncbi:hypothetical protein [uncultured Azohydromonas sp.]|jgi:hypothetical protein|uniref:hypothetical protein n=1 Tax=uncultured Azohydromonas sp. TaxID=487342 RepID=UPI0026368051|nr:hypothetical protein [uncultured Azohydromonas sp.]
MVDLLHDLVGPFELVAATLLRDNRLCRLDEVEDRVWLRGRIADTWVMLDSWLHGEPNPDSASGCSKSEGLVVCTRTRRWRADRSEVSRSDQAEPLYRTQKDWKRAKARQLDDFAQRIRSGGWHDASLWDQLPAMRIIDHAYQQALRI